MVDGTDLSGKLAFDAKSLDQLKQSAKENSPEALKAVAKQFEAIMMNMMLKSMREANPQDGVTDNEQSRMFTSMLDQQLTSNLSAKGLGLADVLVRQLSKTMPNAASAQDKQPLQAILNQARTPKNAVTNAASESAPKTMPDTILDQLLSIEPLNTIEKLAAPLTETLAKKADKLGALGDNVSHFLDKMITHAKAASQSTGIPSHLMLGQAALETGWGKREIKDINGTNSHNLFGIKATGNWKGKVAETLTTEYINGVKQKRIEKFRAYDSYADSFKDFANLMKSNPRYQHVVANVNNVEGYTHAMQKAGYATDPQYAKKLLSVIQKIADF